MTTIKIYQSAAFVPIFNYSLRDCKKGSPIIKRRSKSRNQEQSVFYVIRQFRKLGMSMVFYEEDSDGDIIMKFEQKGK